MQSITLHSQTVFAQNLCENDSLDEGEECSPGQAGAPCSENCQCVGGSYATKECTKKFYLFTCPEWEYECKCPEGEVWSSNRGRCWFCDNDTYWHHADQECYECFNDNHCSGCTSCNLDSHTCEPTYDTPECFCGDGTTNSLAECNGQPCEECDDGNDIRDDGCSYCRKDYCGDGRINIPFGGSEKDICDDGNESEEDYCSNDCQRLGVCGDGNLFTQGDNPEECDADDSQCVDCKCIGGSEPDYDCVVGGFTFGGCYEWEYECGCPDGTRWSSDQEQCISCPADKPVWMPQEQQCVECTNDSHCSGCTQCDTNSNSCVPHYGGPECYCGDGTVNSLRECNGEACEVCDDGNTEPGDGCSASCTEESCGDGYVDSDGPDNEEDTDDDEQCDNAENNSDTEPDACREDCSNHRCGDGVQDSGEDCDDGNRQDGDGCSRHCNIQCVSDSECQRPAWNCDLCIDGSHRNGCICDEGTCARTLVKDCSCTTGDCNLCEGDLLNNPCASNPAKPCEFCWLAEMMTPIPGPGPVERDTCTPYPNAEILWPDECGSGDDGDSSPPASSPSPSSGNNNSNSNSFSFSLSLSSSEASSESFSESYSYSFSFSQSLSFSNSTSESSSDMSSSEKSSSSVSSTNSESSSLSSLEEDDSTDEGADQDDDGDDSGDSDDGDEGEDQEEDGNDDTSNDGETGEQSSPQDESSTPLISSSSSSYAQCDFCPACVSCRRCGIGLFNVCDEQECSNLGLCDFVGSTLAGECLPDATICEVCDL